MPVKSYLSQRIEVVHALRHSPRLILGTAGLVLSLLAVAGCSRTPQLAGDRDALSAADALWTAITAKDSDLLENSAAAIGKLHAEAHLTDEAYGALENVMQTARAGNWSDARAALKTFVRGQRPPERRPSA
jgi:hypothetical protein